MANSTASLSEHTALLVVLDADAPRAAKISRQLRLASAPLARQPQIRRLTTLHECLAPDLVQEINKPLRLIVLGQAADISQRDALARLAQAVPDVAVIALALPLPAPETERRGPGSGLTVKAPSTFAWLAPEHITASHLWPFVALAVADRSAGPPLTATPALPPASILQTFHALSLALTESGDEATIYDRLLAQVAAAIPCDNCSLLVTRGEWLSLAHYRGKLALRPGDDYRLSISGTANIHRIFASGEPLIIADTRREPGWLRLSHSLEVRSWAGAPITVNGQIIALLCVDSFTPERYRTSHLSLLTLFAGQAALALQNIQLRQSTQRQLRELRVLHAIATACNEALDEDTLIQQTTDIIGESIYPDNFGILRFDPERGQLVAHSGYRFVTQRHDVPRLVPGEGIIGQVFLTGLSRLIDDVRQAPDYLAVDPETRSELCVPLRGSQGIHGVINVESRAVAAFSEADERLLATVGGQIAAAVEKLRLLEVERRRRREAETVQQAMAALQSSLEQEEVLHLILSAMAQVLPYDSASVMLVDGNILRQVASRGFSATDRVETVTLPVENRLFAELRRTRRPIVIADVRDDPRFTRLEVTRNVRGWMGIPLIARNEVIGELTLDSHEVGAYRSDDMAIAETIARHAALAIVNARLFQAEQVARRQAEIIRGATAAISESLDLDTILSTLLEQLAQIVPYDSGNVVLLDAEGMPAVRAHKGYETWTDVDAVLAAGRRLRQSRVIEDLFEGQTSILIPDTHHHPDWVIFEPTRYVRNFIGIPIISQGQTIGIYALDKAQPGFFTPHHLYLVETLAAQTATAIQNAHLFEAAQRSAAELQSFSEILFRLNSSPLVGEAFPQIGPMLLELTGADRISLLVFDERREWAEILSEIQRDAPSLMARRFRLPDVPLIEKIMKGEPFLIPDLRQVDAEPIVSRLVAAGYRAYSTLPLRVGDRVIGTVNLGWRREMSNDGARLSLLARVAHAVALAVERSQLFVTTRQWAQQLRVLNGLAAELAGILEADPLCQTVARTLHEAFGYRAVRIYLQGDKQRFLSLTGYAGAGAPGSDALEYEEGLLPSTSVQSPAPSGPDRRDQPSERPLQLPLRISGQLLGVLEIDGPDDALLNENDRVMLALVADQLTAALQTAYLFGQTQRRAAELEIVADLSASLRHATTVQAILPIVLQKAVAEMDGSSGAVYLVDEQGEGLSLAVTHPHRPISERRIAGPGLALARQVVTSGGLQVSPASTAVALPAVSAADTGSKPFFGLGLPLRAHDRLTGVLVLQVTPKHTFNDAEHRMLRAITDIAGGAIDRATVLENLEQRIAERTQALAEANERLQELDRLKSKFVSDVSHELRTPMTNLTLYLDLLQSGRPEKQKQYIEVLKKQANRLSSLVEDILSLSRLDMRQETLRLKPVGLNDIVRLAASSFEPRAEAAGLDLQVRLSQGLPPLMGEPNQLAQVVNHLLSNAFNYTRNGQVAVSTVWNPALSRLGLVVQDSGMGIAAHELDRIFDRFYRGELAGQLSTPGNGLGLAIVKEVVELHQGEIEVESQPDQGTTFRIWFPVDEAKTGPAAAADIMSALH